VRLSALSAERCDPAQTGLAVPDHDAELAHLIDRLGARFGLRRVTRLVPQDAHVPERACKLINANLPFPYPSPVKGSVNMQGLRHCSYSSADQDSLTPIRPVRLFAKPERIKATAEVPDGPPMHFTWRNARYIVTRAEGPERIAMEWWHDQWGRKLTRDYFRVQSHDGIRVWLYREGFFNDRDPPRWFVHGVFA
jgi:protein ImuB